MMTPRTLIFALALTLVGCRSVTIGDSVGVTIRADANYAIPGATVSDLTRQIETDAAWRSSIPGSDLVISIGGNDVMWYGAAYLFSGHWTAQHGEAVWLASIHDEGVLRSAVATFRAEWLRMADDVTALAPRHVVVLTIYNPLVNITDATAQRYLRDLNDWIAGRACDRGWVPARVDIAFNGDGTRDPGALIGADGLHPSESGQQMIDQEIASAHCLRAATTTARPLPFTRSAARA